MPMLDVAYLVISIAYITAFVALVWSVINNTLCVMNTSVACSSKISTMKTEYLHSHDIPAAQPSEIGLAGSLMSKKLRPDLQTA